MYKHGKLDRNHAAIVAALRAVGAEVQSLADVGNGCPDLLVAYRGRWHLLEVKMFRPSLTIAEEQWHKRFGAIAPIWIVTSTDEALAAIGAVEYQTGVDNNAGK